MTDLPHAPPEAEVRARWGSFAWTPDNAVEAASIIARYPPGRQASAVMPLLFLAQQQVGAETNTHGWLPVPVIEFLAAQLGMPFMRAYEVASFYTMYNLAPVGRYLVQVCGTTPCMLRGSDGLLSACANKGLAMGKTTPDGLFTLMEVECLGACANAPMVQINDDNYEDLDYDRMTALLGALANDEPVTPGSSIGRRVSCPEDGPTTLVEMASDNHDYRKEWA